jgi:hypothetical protein
MGCLLELRPEYLLCDFEYVVLAIFIEKNK